jgi:hypothetical protein
MQDVRRVYICYRLTCLQLRAREVEASKYSRDQAEDVIGPDLARVSANLAGMVVLEQMLPS